MAARGSSRRACRAALLLALSLMASSCVYAADEEAGAEAADAESPLNQLVGRVRLESEAEADVAEQLLRAMTSVATEIVTGQPDDLVFAAEAPEGVDSVNISAVASRVIAASIATWQMGVWDAPSNRGLRAQKFYFFERWHYYQVPKDPIGTFVMFHGCYHDASGSWPWDPTYCPECLGLPEEVAHTKQALAMGYAVLAVESRNRTIGKSGRCFNAGSDPAISDMPQAPYVIQNFLYEQGLQDKPVYVMGISSGASFAVKLPKAFYLPGFDIKISGVLSEVNAISWESWSLTDRFGQLRFPGFPPTAFLSMQNDPSTHTLILDSVQNLNALGVPSDWIPVKERPVTPSWFSDRSPVITPRQSAAIVEGLRAIGAIDANGWLADDPRMGNVIEGSPLYDWQVRLADKLPWLHGSMNKPPMLSVLSDRSSIFEELNVAYAMHEAIADYTVPVLVWFQSRGRMNLKTLAAQLGVQKLTPLTARRQYGNPLLRLKARQRMIEKAKAIAASASVAPLPEWSAPPPSPPSPPYPVYYK